MVSDRLGDRVDRVSGKAKEWAGRTVGNSRLQREGRVQSGAANARIKIRNTTKKTITMVQEWMADRRRR